MNYILIPMLILLSCCSDSKYRSEIFCQSRSVKIKLLENSPNKIFLITANIVNLSKYSDAGEYGTTNFKPELGQFATKFVLDDYDNSLCPIFANGELLTQDNSGYIEVLKSMGSGQKVRVKMKVVIVKGENGMFYRMVNDIKLLK